MHNEYRSMAALGKYKNRDGYLPKAAKMIELVCKTSKIAKNVQTSFEKKNIFHSESENI